MNSEFHDGRERQLAFLDRRLHELETQSAGAARSLISATILERRTQRRAELEREVLRLRHERERLECERKLERSIVSEEDLERHLSQIERQLREVLADRDRWFRESLEGRRRRQDDFRLLARLKDENERLTAELLRCATAMCNDRTEERDPRLRRVWHMLRLSGT
jgi:hypothetical protein